MEARPPIDARTLQRIAAECQVSPRTLEHWRKRGLLPSPTRQPRGRAVWHYPPDSEHQLQRVLHWRTRTRSLELIAIALWIEGFQLSTGRARSALQEVAHAIASELPPQQDLHAFIETMAYKVAGARGKRGLPRVARMKSEERVRACAYLLAVVLDAEDEVNAREGDTVLVERMFGLRSGQGGGLAAHEPFIDALHGLRPLMAPPKLLAALDWAGDEHLEVARAAAGLIGAWMPVIGPELVADQGTRGKPFRQALAGLPDPGPEIYAQLALQTLLALHEKQPPTAEITEMSEALQSSNTSVQMLAMLAPGRRAAGFRTLPPYARASVREGLPRGHDAGLDGEAERGHRRSQG
ncbi:MAG TPA: MerR family transcriptional regulator [Solirubrobacteraceae bacterium]|jgi:DNA-binding transcriptional MerR regulator|nr:MerR family transcriptional regulator [Solirubrobacteraceae bacterium]